MTVVLLSAYQQLEIRQGVIEAILKGGAIDGWPLSTIINVADEMVNYIVNGKEKED